MSVIVRGIAHLETARVPVQPLPRTAASPARLHVYSPQTSEVELLVEANGKTLAVEIKAGQTVANDRFRTLEQVAGIPEAAVDASLWR
jgi:hypothetical protein